MKLPRVKICGLTRAADVARAVSAGADAVGFVHYAPSPRHLAVEALGELGSSVPADVEKVVVLVDTPPGEAESLCTGAGARAVQLCGSEDPTAWRDFPFWILRRIGVDERAERELEAWREVAAGFVLDHPASPGGSGLPVAIEIAQELAGRAPCLLAGGLDASNVEERVQRVGPAGVDASSRLEISPGVKDHHHVQRFVNAALRALD